MNTHSGCDNGLGNPGWTARFLGMFLLYTMCSCGAWAAEADWKVFDVDGAELPFVLVRGAPGVCFTLFTNGGEPRVLGCSTPPGHPDLRCVDYYAGCAGTSNMTSFYRRVVLDIRKGVLLGAGDLGERWTGRPGIDPDDPGVEPGVASITWIWGTSTVELRGEEGEASRIIHLVPQDASGAASTDSDEEFLEKVFHRPGRFLRFDEPIPGEIASIAWRSFGLSGFPDVAFILFREPAGFCLRLPTGGSLPQAVCWRPAGDGPDIRELDYRFSFLDRHGRRREVRRSVRVDCRHRTILEARNGRGQRIPIGEKVAPDPRSLFRFPIPPGTARIKYLKTIDEALGIYTAQMGDTAESISLACFGTASRAAEIARLNFLDNPDRIEAGEELIVTVRPLKF